MILIVLLEAKKSSGRGEEQCWNGREEKGMEGKGKRAEGSEEIYRGVRCAEMPLSDLEMSSMAHALDEVLDWSESPPHLRDAKWVLYGRTSGVGYEEADQGVHHVA